MMLLTRIANSTGDLDRTLAALRLVNSYLIHKSGQLQEPAKANGLSARLHRNKRIPKGINVRRRLKTARLLTPPRPFDRLKTKPIFSTRSPSNTYFLQ